MKCEYCDNEVPSGARTCPSCGAVSAMPAPMVKVSPPSGSAIKAEQPSRSKKEHCGEAEQYPTPDEELPPSMPPKKSPCRRFIFMLLGIFLGVFGLHFLYARRMVAFIIVLACLTISIINDWAGVGVVTWLVTFISTFTVRTDGSGLKMEWF